MKKNQIKSLGLPRIDYFFKSDFQEIYKTISRIIPEIKHKKVILYAPTFRGKKSSHTGKDVVEQFLEISNLLPKDYLIIASLHPYDKVTIEKSNVEKSNIIFNTEIEIEDLMIISDMLITDYSSVFFDYSILEKPIAFFAPDLEEYEKERGFYVDYTSFVPGPIFKDVLSINQWIEAGDFSLEKVKRIKYESFDYLDGNSSKRVVDYLIDNV